MKNTIFISHANPENNYFAAWLASKLHLLGYKVWVDVNDINPGQYFNHDYERAILDDAIRFLAIVSSDYIRKAQRNDSGVMNEILCARTIKNINDFIVPIKYDDCNYDNFPVGIRGRDAISFMNNWAEGLRTLVQYFEKNEIIKNEVQANVTQFWFESQKIKSEPYKKKEKYYTNLFEFLFPKNVYIHRVSSFDDTSLKNIPFTFIKESDRIITFESKEDLVSYLDINLSYQIRTSSFFDNQTMIIDEYFSLVEPSKKIVRLLNKVFTHFLKVRGLKSYLQSNKKEVFFFPYSHENKKMINLKKFGKGRRNLIGTSSDFTWYFGISHHTIIFPKPAYKIFYHLIFTDNRGSFLEQSEQHELRRSLASTWYNRKWLETLIAMMYKISSFNENEINIKIGQHSALKINVLPIELFSEYGYKEPSNENAIL